MKKQVKRLLALALTLALAVGIMPATMAASTTGYYTAETIEEMGGNTEKWEYLLSEYGTKEANVYGWLCSTGDTSGADGFWFLLTPGSGTFYTNGSLDGTVYTIEDTKKMALDDVMDKSEKMYNYLTGDDISFEDAAGYNIPQPTIEPDVTNPPTETAEPNEQPAHRITFVDVAEDAWYYDAVMALADSGIIQGKGGDVFDPNGYLTVGEMAALICRIDARLKVDEFDPTLSVSSKIYGTRTFDEPTSWAHQYILKATANNYARWDPEAYAEPVLRGEAIGICTAFAYVMTDYTTMTRDANGKLWWGKSKICYDFTTGTALNVDWRSFTHMIADWDTRNGVQHGGGACDCSEYDVAEHHWADNNISMAYGLGIVHGTDNNGTSNCHGTLTRAEMCQMLYNMGIFDGETVGILKPNVIVWDMVKQCLTDRWGNPIDVS